MLRFRAALLIVAARGIAAKVAVLAILMAGTLTVTAPAAHAYIDPGTGTFLLQAVFGVLAAAAAAIVGLWGHIKHRARRLVARSTGTTGDRPASAGPPADRRANGRH